MLQSSTCLGDTSVCQYGLTVAFWIKFTSVADNTYIISTGNQGFKVSYSNTPQRYVSIATQTTEMLYSKQSTELLP